MTAEPRRKMERNGILAVMGAGTRLSDAVSIFDGLGMREIAHALDDVLADLSKVGETIPAQCDAAHLVPTPCCTYQDHGGKHPVCACPNHALSDLHPWGRKGGIGPVDRDVP